MTQTITRWKILDIIKASEKVLKDKGIDKPRLNAELLLADTLKTERINLYLNFEKPLNESEISEYREKIKKRLRHEPLQYIIGRTEFYGKQFIVNPSVLIPRQETEVLVEKSIEIIKEFSNPKVLEIGTGSGCIAVSIADETNCSIDAIDISNDALLVASENSDLNGTGSKTAFSNKNILTDFNDFEGYNIIISNPPYIGADEINLLDEEIKAFEPLNALTDNADGYTFYRKILELAKKTEGSLRLIMEIGDHKKDAVEKLINDSGFTEYKFYTDLMNFCRVVQIIKNQVQ